MPNPFRNLPSVNQLLESEPLKKMVDSVNHRVVADGVRTFLDDLRAKVSTTAEEFQIPSTGEMADRIAKWLEDEQVPTLRTVINGTGVVLHTGLGRAPLCDSAVAAVQELSTGYSSVEIDLATGGRGQRVKAIEKLLCELTGAEAAVVVNNNAAATMITLSELAKDKEVIVSRGQLIEIGGSYRLPEVMECSGAKLKAIGTTNKTRAVDYENAVNEETGALMLVHPSNFKIVGFTESASIEELVAIGRAKNLPVIDDVGSGALLDFAKFGLDDEPVVTESVTAGADVVLFSGDKLVGGPQCGIIVGRKEFVSRILKNPLMRAMRVGKMTLAALQATLLEYRKPETAEQKIPLLRMLSMPIGNLKLRAEKIAGQIGGCTYIKSVAAVEEQSMLGGGSLPDQRIGTWCVSIEPQDLSLTQLTTKLREATPAIMGRVFKERLLLDMRTIAPAQDLTLVEIFEGLEI